MPFIQTTIGKISASALIGSTVCGINAFGFAASVIPRAERAYLTPANSNIQFLWSGNSPTLTFGHNLATNGFALVEGNGNIQSLLFIQGTAGSVSTLTITIEN